MVGHMAEVGRGVDQGTPEELEELKTLRLFSTRLVVVLFSFSFVRGRGWDRFSMIRLGLCPDFGIYRAFNRLLFGHPSFHYSSVFCIMAQER